MLVVSIVARRAPLRIGPQSIEAPPSSVAGEGVVGADLAYAAWNPADKSANITLSDTNHTATGDDDDPGAVRADQFRDTGKWYFEADMVDAGSGASGIGLTKGDAVLANVGPSNTDSIVWLGGGGIFLDEVFQINIGSPNARTARVAYNATTHLVWINRDDEGWNGDEDADPATGVGGIDVSGIDMDGLYPVFASGATGQTCTANFGETPFAYPKPSGFLPWLGGTIATGVSGDGALASAGSAVEGEGTSKSTGTGALAAPAADVDGVGGPLNSGLLVAGASTIAGAGTSKSTGTGALAGSASVVDGDGSVSGGETYESPESYANHNGTGARNGSITVTTNASLGSGAGTQSNLVDSAKANNSTDACWVNNSQGAAMQFTFQLDTKAIITEAKWYQNGTSAQPGVWKWAGSNDGSSFTDLTATFTLNAGSAGDVIGDLSANTVGYTYYKLYQTTNAGGNDTPWLWECEFKIGNLL